MKSRPEDVFTGRHLNTIIEHSGAKVVSLEEFFSELETATAPLIDKIIVAARRSQPPLLSSDEKQLWEVFFHYQWKRSPELAESLKGRLAPDAMMARALDRK